MRNPGVGGGSGPGGMGEGALPGPVERLTHLTRMSGGNTDIVKVALRRPVQHIAHVLDEADVAPDMEEGTGGQWGARGKVREWGSQSRRNRQVRGV